MVASQGQLKTGFVLYMQANLPHLLECKVEQHHQERGHKVLWIPPDCLDLQLIELFWAAGKNNVARLSSAMIGKWWKQSSTC